MDQRYQPVKPRVTALVFLVLLGALAALNLLTPEREFSENENRYLQTFPEFSVNALLSAKFTADFDRYVTDQFVFRDGWVGVKTLAERAMGKPASGGVYFARDGYLIEIFDSVDTALYERNLGYVAQFSERVRGLGVEVRAVLAPTASMVLADKLPRFAPEVDQRALLDRAREALPGFVDVSGALMEHSGEYVYYRTDHHWTSLGAFYAWREWRAQCGKPARGLDDFSQETLSDRFYGTTYSKASLYSARPDTITAFLPTDAPPYTVDYNNGQTVTDTIYAREYLDVKDKYSVFLNANQPFTRIRSGNQNGERLLVVKDSFANTFLQMVLADYEEILVIDPRYYKLSAYELVEREGITDVLLLYNVKGFAGDTSLYYLTT